MPGNFVELVLTCGSWQEAQKIADVLLDKRLVACVEMMEVKSKYHWQGKIEKAEEVKLIMQTVSNNFEKVEEQIRKLHSYDTFVLHQIPLGRVSAEAAEWLTSETTEDN